MSEDEAGKQSDSKTGPQRDAQNRFVKGNSGGPGRPKGSRHKLGEDFAQAFQRHFKTEGLDAIRRVFADDPSSYLNVISKIIPKDVAVELTQISHEEALRQLEGQDTEAPE